MNKEIVNYIILKEEEKIVLNRMRYIMYYGATIRNGQYALIRKVNKCKIYHNCTTNTKKMELMSIKQYSLR